MRSLSISQPTCWAIENPASGLLKTRAVVAGLPWVDVDFCSYGAPYRKRTRLWTNLTDFEWAPLCRQNCHACVDGCHAHWAQKASKRRGDGWSTTQLHTMPVLLCEAIFEAARLKRLQPEP